MVETVVPKEPLAVVKVVRGKRKNQVSIMLDFNNGRYDSMGLNYVSRR